jgi:NADPH oxidase
MNYYKISFETDTNVLRLAGLIAPDPVTGVLTRPTTWQLGFTTLAGSTGHIATLVMIIMYTAAVDSVRRPSFEVFWYSHHLFVVFYGVLMAHGAAALLEPANFYIWTIAPLVFYAIERTIRLVRSKQECIVTEAIAHPSRVLEFRLKKTTFNYKPGQYVFLCCPYIADFEWHPFTISSSPDEDFVSVHIRLAGDWTGSLHQLVNPQKKGDGSVVQSNMINAPNGRPIILIDGPFGAASEDVFKFETAMLFAAGIGVTPMASILKTVRYCILNNVDSCMIKSVDFIWINREKTSFEWFLDLLAEMERTCDFLNIQLYFTGKITRKEELKDVEDGLDAITGLRAQTRLGRPDIKQIFATKAAACQGKRIGVFFCGPPIVSKSLYAACKKHTDTKVGTRFIYHKENF